MDKTSNKYWSLYICLALVLATFIAYEPMRHNGFVNYDDDVYVTENRNVNRGITAESVFWAFTNPHRSMWHPLTSLSHMLDCQLFGLVPFWHHLTSLLFHIAGTLLLFWILKRMTGAVWLSAFVAAVFALHPLNVESVAWVAERKSVLSSFFWMLTIAAYLRYAERPGIDRYLLVVLVFCLALMAKPMVVTLPFALLLLDYWPLGRFQWGRQSREESSMQSESAKVSYRNSPSWRLVVEKIPLFILSAVLSVITFIAQKSGGAVMWTDSLPLNFRIPNALVSYLTYIGKMFWPSRLAVFYPHPRGTVSIWLAVVVALLLLALSIWVIRSARSRRYLLVGWLWYLGTLVPVVGLVQAGGQARADRYMYLPMIGLLIIITWGLCELAAKWRYRKTALGISAGLSLVVLLICSRMQLRHWQNNLTLFGHALKVTENNFVMHSSFGGALFEKGRFDEAVAHFNEALRINPQYLEARRNIGIVFLRRGKIDEAIMVFTDLLSSGGDWPKAHNYLGQAYAEKGEFGLAVQNYNEALRLKPDYVDAIENLGVALKEQGKINEAIKEWKRALQLAPDNPDVHYNMGLVMAEQYKYDEAVRHFNAALAAKPDWPETHYNLGCVYYLRGKFEPAVEQCTEALRLKPDYLSARIMLARTLVELGKVQLAVEHYYRILQSEPNQVSVLKNLAWILAAAEDVKLRNPVDAVKFAERACELTNYKQPRMLDTLAVAYAATGRFAEAVETAEKALEFALSADKKDLADEIQKRLQLYKAGQPYCWPSPKASSD